MCAAPKGNKFAIGNKGGAPRLYSSPEELESEISRYFEECEKNKENPKITGLALFLGFASKQSLYDYEKNEKFSYPIKRALLCVEMHYEEGLNTFKYGGSVFALKNMGWKDQIDQNVNQTITTVTPQVIDNGTPLAGSEKEIKE